MRVVGVGQDGYETFSARLPHGAEPAVVAHDADQLIERPLDAYRDADGDLVLRFRVRSSSGEARPAPRPPGRDAGLVLADGEVPAVRQRVAAYGVVVSDRGLLATQYSSTTAVEGRWGMPGGGIDRDEEPNDTVVREVHEETSQQVVLEDLVAVQTSHWIGRSPTGRAEDFHAVRLVYRASCPDPGDPVVLDVGGTTADARWVPLVDWRSVAWTVNWRQALEQLLPG